jgi:glycosyltransferase involved in cell wall biosynthesis
MMTTPVSVIIPCKDDPEIIECIRSIDYEPAVAEIVFNGSPKKFIKWVKSELKKQDRNVIFHELPKPNLALALEYGTQHAKHDLILYMDSDCRFHPGAVQRFISVASKHDITRNVFKGEVVFESGTSHIGRIIASSRTHHTAEVLTAYKPPLMISKQILPNIGGYAFNERLIWREDSDLDNRIREAGIAILPVSGGLIDHHAITLKTDLRSTFRYGIGLAIANALYIKLTEVPRSTMSAYRSKGAIVALYMLFRNRIYDAGYIYARIRLLSPKYLNDKIIR